MNKNSERYRLWIGAGLILIAIVLIVVVIINVMRGQETGNMTIGGESKVTGLLCRDTKLIHPALEKVPMSSHVNTITANFRDDKLSSISLVYEGDYETEQKAETARNFAGTEFSLILTKKYGEKDDIFSSNTLVDGTKMQMTQTTRDVSKINMKTVTYFLLDQGTNIAKSLDGLKKQYEAKGFTCEISD